MVQWAEPHQFLMEAQSDCTTRVVLSILPVCIPQTYRGSTSSSVPAAPQPSLHLPGLPVAVCDFIGFSFVPLGAWALLPWV